MKNKRKRERKREREQGQVNLTGAAAKYAVIFQLIATRNAIVHIFS